MKRCASILIVLAGLPGLLCGCAAQPLPAELFYRIDAKPLPVTPVSEAPAVLVEGFDAYGVYADRQLIFSRPEAGGALEQYRHQYWAEPPALMLGDGLRRSLRAALGEQKVQGRNARERADYVIRPRLRRLEQVIGPGGTVAVYAADFVVTRESNEPRFVLAFEQARAVASDAPDAYAAAVGELAAQANQQLLQRLLEEFRR